MFIITASRRGQPFRATRLQRASAAVLAIRLIEDGCTDVGITDETGTKMNLRDFRQQHLPGLSAIRPSASI